MFNELYVIVGGSPTQHVTLRGPVHHGYLPNTGDISIERGDSFKTIIEQISAMFNEIYTISGGATTAKVTLRGPKSNAYLPNTRDFHGRARRQLQDHRWSDQRDVRRVLCERGQRRCISILEFFECHEFPIYPADLRRIRRLSHD
jgi:hypothetical protein